MLSEKEIISKFLRPLAINREAQNLNNDGAILKQSNSNFVISSDMMIENIHFYENDDPKLLGRKLLRVNLSDLAAMGCKPYGYILNLGIPKLIEKVKSSDIDEIIIATSPTIEGDATSFYIKDQLNDHKTLISRIAYGVPMGGELEYVDNTTLGRAIQGRREIN